MLSALEMAFIQYLEHYISAIIIIIINLSTCACFYFITASTYLLAHYNLEGAALKLHMKHTSLLSKI